MSDTTTTTVVSVRTSGPYTLLFVPPKQQLGCANSAMKKKWVWPSGNGCQCKSPVSTTTNFSTHAKPGQTEQCAQKITENNDTLRNTLAALNTVTTSHSISMTSGRSHTEHLSQGLTCVVDSLHH